MYLYSLKFYFIRFWVRWTILKRGEIEVFEENKLEITGADLCWCG